jgi:hypothetical protein
MDQIEKRPTTSLKAAAQNSRVHTEAQIDQIATSMEKFGWTIPVLLDENGTIIAGHARVRAAIKLKITEVPCLVASGWSEAKKEAYQITDNRLSELSEWDNDILGDQIKRLNAEQFDLGFLDMSGFNVDLFKPMLDPKTNTATITGQQVTDAQAGQNTRFKDGNNTKQTYEVACPHCGGLFDVSI